jgi:ApeA N-terminal domain 1
LLIPKEQAEFEAGNEVRGVYWIADEPQTEAAGVLRWDQELGAELWLVDPPNEWRNTPLSFRRGPFRIFGETPDHKKVTLPGAIVAGSTIGGSSELRLIDRTLVASRHLSPSDEWKKLIVQTANLHEWLPITGLGGHATFGKHGTETLRIEWKRPRSMHVGLPRANLEFANRMSATPWRQPAQRVETGLDAIFTVKNRDSIEALHESYVTPLLNLSILASGRPDAVIHESVRRGRFDQAIILRAGPRVESREWQPMRPPLFYAGDLPDPRDGIKRWVRLHARLSPAIEVFAESINQGGWTPERLLKVAGSLETYHRVLYEKAWRKRWHKTNPNKKIGTRPYFLDMLDDLQRLSGVPEATTGMTGANRKLFTASRNHFAHLDEPSYNYSVDQVRDALFESIRRGVALMQVGLLRRLGFTGAQAREQMAEHYRGWPSLL